MVVKTERESSLVTLSLKCTIFEIFDLYVYNDLETRVRGNSRSSKIIPFNPAPMTSDFLTFRSNHRPISHRFREKQQFLSKIAKFYHSCVFTAPDEGYPLELDIGVGVRRN